MKRQQRTSTAKAVRTRYGLTQEQLALYLDITVGLLKMVEIDRRELPVTAFLKLNKLAMFSPPAATTPDTTTPNTSIEKEKRNLRLEKLRLERAVEQMQTKYMAAINGLALSQHYLQNPPADKGEELMLQLLEQKAKQAIKKYSLEKQAYLQWRMGWLEKMLEE